MRFSRQSRVDVQYGFLLMISNQNWTPGVIRGGWERGGRDKLVSKMKIVAVAAFTRTLCPIWL
jgi:hypothetical protein